MEDQQNQDVQVPEADDTQVTPEEEPKAFKSQQDFDSALEKRLARERRKLEKEIKEKADEEARRSRMDETERLKVEREEARQAAQAAQDKANTRIVRAEAKAQAASLGVKAEKLPYVIKLADLDGIDVDDEGEADIEAIRASVTQVLTDLPELVATPEPEATPEARRRAPDASSSRGPFAGIGQGDESTRQFNDILRARGLSSGVS